MAHGQECPLLDNEERRLLDQARGRVLLFHLEGPMSFGAAKAISQRLGIVGNYDVLILDLTDVPRLGITASLAIENMVKEAYGQRRSVFIVGAIGNVRDRLKRLDLIPYLMPPALSINRHEALLRSLSLVVPPPEQVQVQPRPAQPGPIRE